MQPVTRLSSLAAAPLLPERTARLEASEFELHRSEDSLGPSEVLTFVRAIQACAFASSRSASPRPVFFSRNRANRSSILYPAGSFAYPEICCLPRSTPFGEKLLSFRIAQYP